MSRTGRWWRAGLLVLATLVPACALGNAIEELQAAGHLQIDSEITPLDNVVPGQKLQLVLRVATDTWFTGGTRIDIPEVPGLVILQNEQFAANASETRLGKTWVVQRWTLDVFPQRAGDFTVPPVTLRLQVNGGESAEIEGTGHTPALGFSVVIPEALEEVEHWVAAPAFDVSQSFDRPLEDLVVGDAFEREIRFEAQDVMAMMLPTFEVEKQEGLAAYPSPPKLHNNINRGQASASRVLSISYVVEAPGQYLLPELEFFWWDTQRKELQLLSLPQATIEVGGPAAQQSSSQVSGISKRQLLLGLAGLALLLILLWLARVYLPRLPLARWRAALSRMRKRWQDMRKPALPERLNPGNNAGD